MNEHRVALVVAESFGMQLDALAAKCHVWLVDSVENDAAARRYWAREPHNQGVFQRHRGVTLFQSEGDGREDACLSIFSEIDVHHGEDYEEYRGEYTHVPALSALEVYGGC